MMCSLVIAADQLNVMVNPAGGSVIADRLTAFPIPAISSGYSRRFATTSNAIGAVAGPVSSTARPTALRRGQPDTFTLVRGQKPWA
jgi:hypothetical protein